MTDVLLPRTDGGVAVQFVVSAAVIVVALVLARRSATWRWLIAGVGVLLTALMALRTVH